MASPRVDIFELLKRIDDGDLDYWNKMSDEERKSIAFVVAMRWMSCTHNTDQLKSVNILLNPLVFRLYKHPGLMYRLMLVASSGTRKGYKWVGRHKNKKTYPVSTKLISEFYNMNVDRANSYVNMLTIDELIDCAERLGYDDKSIKSLKDEHKKAVS